MRILVKHYLVMFDATLAVPLVVAVTVCIRQDPLVVAQLISTEK